ncbi:MAG: pitrilysin family protein [Bacilli bacterium]
MKKNKLIGLDLTVSYEKLDNGLSIYVVPVEHVNGIYATLSVKYGADDIEFIPQDEKKMRKLPLGVAHFLEHQMFNQKDGTEPLDFFSKRGCDCNANTRNNKTTYLFSGVNALEENLNKLLDFVFEPYFTDESVLKEKGIIIQEIGMYADDPYSKIFNQSLANTFIENPIKNPVIGNIDSVKSIKKEDLYTCYNTFYQPSNMFLVITGNVIPEEIIKITKENMQNKTFPKCKEVTKKIYNEPDKVVKDKQILQMKVSKKKLCINYKINVSKLKNIKRHEIILYLSFIFDTKLGSVSTFLSQLKKEDLITENFYISYVETDIHILFSIQSETNDPETLTKRVEKELKNLKIAETELERRKKVLLSYQVLGSESIYRVNNKIMDNVTKFGQILYSAYDDIKKLNIKQFNYLINNINFNNKSVLIIEPLNDLQKK